MALNFRRKKYYFEEKSSIKKMCRGWHGEVYGVCPVQGDGKINGKAWYFKARGDRWSFEIQGCPDDRIQEPWGTWPDAGYMSHSEAWSIITGLMNKFVINKGCLANG